MKLTAVNGNFFIEPRMHSELKTEALRKRVEKSGSGLLIPDSKPKNQGQDFEGIPNVGVIRYLPEDYDGELKVGTIVVFDVPAPKGFKNPEDQDMTLFPVKREQIVAVIVEGSND